MAGAETTRIQHEFSTAKSVLILAVVIGCFAILWPRVFHPMIQATLMRNSASSTEKERDSGNDTMRPLPSRCNPVCCDIIYENKIDFKFFAELCKSVIEREMATDGGIRKHRREKYPPPGMLERCRKKIKEVCDIDISEALTKTKRSSWTSTTSTPTTSKYRIVTTTKTDENNNEEDKTKPKLNLTECLEKHFQLTSNSTGLSRRLANRGVTPLEHQLPTHIRQERPSHVGRKKSNPALKEKGNPFPHIVDRGRPISVIGEDRKTNDADIQRQTSAALRPGMGITQGKPEPSKAVGAMSLLMPIYTLGIVVFFLYTMSKMLMRNQDDRPDAKVIEYHPDPEYRSYVARLRYEKGNRGQPMTYKEFLKKKEDEERKKAAIGLLGNVGRKQVFTAIEGIIAEMDEYRERVKADQHLKTNNDESDLANGQAINHVPVHLDNLSKDKLEDELVRITALDIKEEVQLTEQSSTDANVTNVSNIVLEGSMPADVQLLVAESECLTHTTTEHIDGWSDIEDQPVVVTGKMTISLIGNKEASIHSTETVTSTEAHPVTHGHASLSKPEVISSSPEKKHIEDLANALVDDVLRNQILRVLESKQLRNGSTSPELTSKRSSGIDPKKQHSSENSSFEYVSASQDDLQQRRPHTPIDEEDIDPGVGSDDKNYGCDQKDIGSVGLLSHTSGDNGCNGTNTEDVLDKQCYTVFTNEVVENDENEDEEIDSKDQTPEVEEIRRFN